MIAAPGLPKGTGVATFGQAVDFLPTICELAEVKPEPPEPFQGRSMAKILRNGRGTHREFAVSGCFAQSKDGRVPARCCTPFVVTSRWGYTPVGANGREELYDLAADPLAATDVAGSHPDVLREMRGLLRKGLEEAGAPEAAVQMWTRGGASAGTWARDYSS